MKESDGPASELAPFLRRVPLFSALNELALALLARVSRIMRVRKAEVLFNRDDPGSAAYVVLAGSIAILISTPDGRELVVNHLHAGDCFGELALLTGRPRSASAVASVPSELLLIPRAEFLAVLEREPKVMLRMLQTLAQRLADSVTFESELAFLDASGRLAHTLLHLEREHDVPGVVNISQEEIAQRIGVARQTAAKILGQWRRAGWVQTGRSRITLLNRAALRQQTGEKAD